MLIKFFVVTKSEYSKPPSYKSVLGSSFQPLQSIGRISKFVLSYVVYNKQYDRRNSVHTKTYTLKKRPIRKRKHTKYRKTSLTWETDTSKRITNHITRPYRIHENVCMPI